MVAPFSRDFLLDVDAAAPCRPRACHGGEQRGPSEAGAVGRFVLKGVRSEAWSTFIFARMEGNGRKWEYGAERSALVGSYHCGRGDFWRSGRKEAAFPPPPIDRSISGQTAHAQIKLNLERPNIRSFLEPLVHFWFQDVTRLEEATAFPSFPLR